MNSNTGWSPVRRRVISALILLHLIAVVAAPMSGPPPASNLSRRVATVFDPYLRGAFLAHGYRFFAPNPGPSHLLRYEVLHEDGRVESHRFPDTQEQWPRLYYHRHFMVAEQVNQLSDIPTEQEFAEVVAEQERIIAELRGTEDGQLIRQLRDGLEAEKRSYARQAQLRDGLLEGIAKYFLKYHGGESIRLYTVRHPIPAPSEVVAGFELNDPDSYLERAVFDWPRVEVPLMEEEL